MAGTRASAAHAKLITVTETQPPESQSGPADPPERRPDRLPVSEVAFDRPGGPSPFGEDVTLPLPTDELRYRHS